MEDLPLDRLEAELTSHAAHLAAGTCRWLLMLGEFSRREGWREWGCRSCAHWLSWRCSVSPVAARQHVRVARRLAELPLVLAAFETGELTYSKVRALSRVAGPATEAQLVQLARHSTAAQLERLVRAFRGVEAAELAAANEAHCRRYVKWTWEDDGTLSVRGRLSAEDGAAFIAAVEAEALAELRAAEIEAGNDSAESLPFSGVGGSADPDAAAEAEQPSQVGRGARAADAMMRLIDAARAADAPRSRSSATEIVVHVDADSLSADEEIVDRCEVQDGPALPPETARRLSCDAAVVVIQERGGTPLDVGRRTRRISTPMRRALESRDGCCRFPGCGYRQELQAHHIHHWTRGGGTDRDNLLLLCRFHHRLVHECGYRVDGIGGDPAFRRPDGTLIPAVTPSPPGSPEEVERANAALGLDIGEATCVPHWWGDRLDVALAVDVLCAAEERGPPR